MRILQTKRAAAQVAALSGNARTELLRRLAALPAAFGRPHAHSGLGLRQLATGCYEIRVGLDTRAVLLREGADLVLYLVGNHDEVRRFLKSQ